MSRNGLRKTQSVVNMIPRLEQVDVYQEDIPQKNELLKQHFEGLLNTNQRYYETIANQYVQCRPKLHIRPDFKKGGESLYQRDFIGQKLNYQIPLCNLNTMPEYKTIQPMQLETINRTELIPHKNLQVPISVKGETQLFLQPFNGGSSYNTDFVNYGSNKSMILNPPLHPTVIKDLPFNGSTFYRDNFKKHVKSNANFMIFSSKSQFKNPVSPELPFVTESTNRYTYKPFKTRNFISTEKSKEFTSLPSFKGQFRSTQQADYIDFRSPKIQQ